MKFEVGKKYKNKQDSISLWECIWVNDTCAILITKLSCGYYSTCVLNHEDYLWVEYKEPTIHKRYVTWIGNGPNMFSIITSYRHTKESLAEEFEGTFLRCDEVTYEET